MSMESYQYILGAFKCAELLHHHSHLVVKGDYSDHLLLGELYSAYVEHFDSFAEKGIITYGEQLVAVDGILKMQMMCYKQQTLGQDAIQNALAMEKHILMELTELYNELKGTEELSLGLDDLIMATCSGIERNIYLLTQRSKG
jgi:DNA-binding ferritin-like protein